MVGVLLEAGYRVRLLVRDRERLQGRPWLADVEVVQGDVLQPDSLRPAMEGVDVAYYLIHSMHGGQNFQPRDLVAATNFSQAAQAARVQRIIYLGGLGDSSSELSAHLRSRQLTGDALRTTRVPVTEFRAAIIVGAGSLSFEMIRHLTERVPIMICPRWTVTAVQPIAIRTVLEYLLAALDTPESTGKIIEIGGTTVLTYGDMMREYARIRGLRRLLLPVPVLTPHLSSYWVHWVTPVTADIARPLIEGLRTPVVVQDDSARRLFPAIQPLDYETAVRRALAMLDAGRVETTWNDALMSSQGDVAPVMMVSDAGMIVERRRQEVDASPATVYRSFTRLGGARGWLAWNWAWKLRGMADRLVGGVGFRRGRRDPHALRPGDALDFWRVEAIVPDRLMRLRAEMKVPGRAWLQMEALPLQSSRTELIQTAFFAPKGLFGLLYWYLLYPIHGMIFSDLIRKLAEEAEMEPAAAA